MSKKLSISDIQKYVDEKYGEEKYIVLERFTEKGVSKVKYFCNKHKKEDVKKLEYIRTKQGKAFPCSLCGRESMSFSRTKGIFSKKEIKKQKAKIKRELLKNNPELKIKYENERIRKISKSLIQYHKNNPNASKEQSKKIKDFYNKNPECRVKQSESSAYHFAIHSRKLGYSNGFVYILKNENGIFKIGCSVKPQKRFKDYRNRFFGNFYICKILYGLVEDVNAIEKRWLKETKQFEIKEKDFPKSWLDTSPNEKKWRDGVHETRSFIPEHILNS